jgi:DNA processing protein
MKNRERAWLILGNALLRDSEYRLLVERFGDVEDIVSQPASRLARSGLDESRAAEVAAPDAGRLEQGLTWLENPGHHLIGRDDDRYPELLQRIPDPPLLLYVAGDCDALQLPALAIVGSRNPTQSGSRTAWAFARHLAGTGFTIASGLAEGIDAAAHRGALAAGRDTIAFLGHGIDTVYPVANSELAAEITARGALVSEYPLGTPPRRHHFPERNRLISGISLGTIVVEAARRSGSLITARLAGEQGRAVFALPGSIHNPLARGCHQLIRQGATLVETADDIVAELAPLVGHLLQIPSESTAKEAAPAGDDGEYVELRKLLGHDPVTIDELAIRSGLTIDQLSSMLLILELKGEVESLSGGRYSLLK